jgi:hypothetical protein
MPETSETSPVVDAFLFEDHPEEFVMAAYEEAYDRHTQLQPVNVENNEFYEGIDQELQQRKENPAVQRAAIFIPEIKPAIDTRISKVISHVEETADPVVALPVPSDVSEEDMEQLTWIQHNINVQLRDIGYLTDVFREQVLAAEINRSPSFVKVGWEERWERKAVKIPAVASAFQFIRQLAVVPFGGAVPDAVPRVRYEKVYKGGRPFVTWIEPGRVLYEPNVSDFYEDSVYIMDVTYMEFNKLMAEATMRGWETEPIHRYKQELEAGTSDVATEDTIREEVEASKGTPFVDNTKDGRIQVIEAVIVSYTKGGDKKYSDVVMIGGRYKVHNEERDDKLIGLPYVPVVSNRMPGTIESLSSIDVVKPQQRLFNEAFNMWLDALTYRTFPPLKAPRNFRFRETPVWGPLRIWYCSDPDRLQPVVPNPGEVPDLPPLMNAIAFNIRNTLNASDLDLGNTTQQYEKATKAQFRFLGSATRSVPTFKDYGTTLARVAMMCIQLNQQHAPDKHNWVVNSGIRLDVPSLTGISNPQQVKQDLSFIYSEAKESPVYASPIGQIFIRNIWEQLVRQVAPNDVGRFVPTEEQIKEALMKQTEQAILEMDRQDLEGQLRTIPPANNQPTEVSQ